MCNREKFERSYKTIFTNLFFYDIIKMLGLASNPFGNARGFYYCVVKRMKVSIFGKLREKYSAFSDMLNFIYSENFKIFAMNFAFQTLYE